MDTLLIEPKEWMEASILNNLLRHVYARESERKSSENLQACHPDEVSGFPVISNMVECRLNVKNSCYTSCQIVGLWTVEA